MPLSMFFQTNRGMYRFLEKEVDILAVMKKDTKIKKETEKLIKIFGCLDDNKKSMATSLIDNAAFMIIQLAELREVINKTGMVYNFENGKQKMLCESPANKAYVNLMPKYLQTMKQLVDLLPQNIESPSKDEFISFINEAK